MKPYTYQLEKGSQKHICPNCQKKTYVRYVDTENSNQYLPGEYGRCDREDKCGYHLNPYKDGWYKGKDSKEVKPQRHIPKEPPVTGLSLTPAEIVKKHSGNYNTFATFIKNRYGKEPAEQVLNDYGTGTYQGENPYYKGSIVFYQRDVSGTVRGGKVMPYDPNTGKRVKNPDGKAVMNWIHKLEPTLKESFNLKQCLFGEHLLSSPENDGKPVIIVESEKTAIIASYHFPQYLWLATGGLSNLSAEKLKPCKDRKIVLFPDLSLPNQQGKTVTDKWTEKASETLRTYPDLDLSLSAALESIATDSEKADGWDLADYLLNDPKRLEGIDLLQNAKSVNSDRQQPKPTKDLTESLPRWQSDDTELRAWRNANLTFINQSPTGTGKTSGAIQYAKELRGKDPKNVVLFLFPTRTLAGQVAEKHHLPVCIGGEIWTDEQLFESLQNDGILCLTYEYALTLKQKGILDRLVKAGANIRAFIDEAHELEQHDNIRREAIDFIVNRLGDYCLSREYMTGTVSMTLSKSLNAPVYKSLCPSKVKAHFNALTFDSKRDKWHDALIGQLIQNDGKTIDIVRLNSLRKIQELIDRIVESGICQRSEIAVLTGKRGEISASGDLSEQVKQSIINDERIPDGAKFVFVTSVLDTGVNIRNQNVRVFAVHNGAVGFEDYNLMQFLSRFREVETVDFNYILSETCADREGEKVESVKKQIQNLYDAKLSLYEKQAHNLKGEKVSEYFKHTPDLTNQVPKFRYDTNSQSWKPRTTHIGRECLNVFQKKLGLTATAEYLNSEYQCISSFEVSASRIQKTYYDASAKDQLTNEAVASIAEMLKDPTQRRFLYSLCLEHSDYGILTDVKKIDCIFDCEFYRNRIRMSPEFLAWKEANGETLERGSFGKRVKQFLTYMVFTNHVETSAKWIVENSDDKKYHYQRAKLSLAVFAYLERSRLKADYLTDPVREKEREIQNAVLAVASKYVGIKLKSSELTEKVWTEIKEKDHLWTKDLTSKQVSEVIRAGFLTEKSGKGNRSLTLIRRIGLNDLLGIHTDGCKEHLRHVARNGYPMGTNLLNDTKIIPTHCVPSSPDIKPVGSFDGMHYIYNVAEGVKIKTLIPLWE